MVYRRRDLARLTGLVNSISSLGDVSDNLVDTLGWKLTSLGDVNNYMLKTKSGDTTRSAATRTVLLGNTCNDTLVLSR
jgi:hypothetical protein